jgi:(2Fe-2S) ferredoxin
VAACVIDTPERYGHAGGPVPGAAARRFKIVICRGPECGDRRGSSALHEVFRSALEAHGARDRAELMWQSCFGRCTQGPNVLVREVVAEDKSIGTGFATLPGPRGATALYNGVDSARVERVVTQHVIGGQIVREFIERPGILHSEPVGSTQKER